MQQPQTSEILGPVAVTTIQLARFTSASGPLTKTLSLGENGQLTKETSAQMTAGEVENLTLHTVDDFAEVLAGLTRRQALAYGVSLRGDGPIMSKKQWDIHGQPDGVVLRTRDHFDWPAGGGIWMLDYDPPKNKAGLGREQVLASLYAVMPELKDAAHWWWPSASSCITNTDTGLEIAGIRGQRVYVWVSAACDVPRAGSVLSARMWLAGLGRFDISSAGSLLARTLVDEAVWQPERLDFAAGADCRPPLEQRRGLPVLLGGHSPLDTKLLRDLTEAADEQVAKAKAVAGASVREEADAARAAWIGERATGLQNTRGLTEEKAKEVATQAARSMRLMGDFVLVTEEGKEISIGEILDDRDVWHGTQFHDPLEPSYPDPRIAIVNLHSGGRPYLWSYAHGGCRYELCRCVSTIEIALGGTSLATDQTLEIMRLDGAFYERGRAVVSVTERGEVQPLGAYALKQQLERAIRFQRFDGRAKELRPIDCPDEIARRVLDLKGSTGLPVLSGIVQYPTMTPTGRVLDKPGYDTETGLLLVNPLVQTWAKIPRDPSPQEALHALTTLWAPIAQFPFASDTSRGVALAAMLTAIVRRGLPTAPAFMFAAPAAGSGKTLLASCVVELAGRAPAMSLPDSDAEVAKLLVSLLRKGGGALFFDNVVGTVDSKALNAMLTAPEYDGRILGLSETTGPLPTNALVVLTGNNARPVGDTCRRMLVSTIDAAVESPYLREFSFNPLDRIRAHKSALIVAGLTVLRGWVTAGKPRPAKGSLASFDAWDGLIRQAVVWIGNLEREVLGADAVGYGDPIADIQSQFAADDDSEALRSVLENWSVAQDGQGFKASELYKALDGARRGEYAGGLGALGMALYEAMPKAQSAKGMSRWLKSVKGRVVGGFRIEGEHDTIANNTTWRVGRPK